MLKNPDMMADRPALSNKERIQLSHQEMPLRPAASRIKNFEEVPIGYSNTQAVEEAMRCLHCKKSPCVGACPVGIDIPGFIRLIELGDTAAAAKKIREKNFLPAICGRVCPQDKQCQAVCVVGRKNLPVGIGNLERYAADFERINGLIEIPEVEDLFSPLLTSIPLQLLSYHIAVMRGCNVDQPRNLAKSVTVE